MTKSSILFHMPVFSNLEYFDQNNVIQPILSFKETFIIFTKIL